jgi:hypothetical protein
MEWWAEGKGEREQKGHEAQHQLKTYKHNSWQCATHRACQQLPGCCCASGQYRPGHVICSQGGNTRTIAAMHHNLQNHVLSSQSCTAK